MKASTRDLRRLHDEVAEAGQRHAARPALVDQGGDARAHAAHVGIQAEAAGDVAGRRGRACRSGRAAPACLGSPCSPAHSTARMLSATAATRPVRDSDVQHGIASQRRIDDPPALQNQVEYLAHAVLGKCLISRIRPSRWRRCRLSHRFGAKAILFAPASCARCASRPDGGRPSWAIDSAS